MYSIQCLSKMKFPLISVIIVAHDRKKYLQQALKSTLEQTLPRKYFEVIVVKNFSDVELDKFIIENSCLMICTKENTFGSKLALGVASAKGDIICCLDDDDLYKPNKLETIKRVFNKYNDLIFIHHEHDTLREDGKIYRSLHHSTKKTIVYGIQDSNYYSFFQLIQTDPLFNMSSIVFRKCLFDEKILLNSNVTNGWDSIIFLMALSSNKVLIAIPDVLSTYRIHDSTSLMNLPLESFLEFKERWYKGYVNSLRAVERLLSNSTYSSKMLRCIILEGEIEKMISSKKNANKVLFAKKIIAFLTCFYYIPLPRYLFLIMVSTLYLFSNKGSKLLFYESFKGKFI